MNYSRLERFEALEDVAIVSLLESSEAGHCYAQVAAKRPSNMCTTLNTVHRDDSIAMSVQDAVGAQWGYDSWARRLWRSRDARQSVRLQRWSFCRFNGLKAWSNGMFFWTALVGRCVPGGMNGLCRGGEPDLRGWHVLERCVTFSATVRLNGLRGHCEKYRELRLKRPKWDVSYVSQKRGLSVS